MNFFFIFSNDRYIKSDNFNRCWFLSLNFKQIALTLLSPTNYYSYTKRYCKIGMNINISSNRRCGQTTLQGKVLVSVIIWLLYLKNYWKLHIYYRNILEYKNCKTC